MKKIKTGIVGLGRITAGYGQPGDIRAYCHVGGIAFSEKVELAAVADFSDEATSAFKEKWGSTFPDIAYHSSMEEMLDQHDLDIVTVCVRGPHHHSTMVKVIESSPRAIFLEKPPTCSLSEMDDICEKARSGSIPVTVSYSRHWDPQVMHMARLIKEGLIGDVVSVVGYCPGTFLSFASHTTDLICQFAGYCPEAVVACGIAGEDVPEGFEPEPILKGSLIDFSNGVLGIHVGNNGEHGGFYCEINGTDGRARAGIYTECTAANKAGEPIDLVTRGLPERISPFTVAYDQIADHLNGGPLPDCTDHDFTVVNELGFAGVESFLTGQRISIPNSNRTRRIYANG